MVTSVQPHKGNFFFYVYAAVGILFLLPLRCFFFLPVVNV